MLSFPFSPSTSGLGFGGGPAVASSGGPFSVAPATFGGIQSGSLDTRSAALLGAAIVGAVIIYKIAK